jgi:hypothetical protein
MADFFVTTTTITTAKSLDERPFHVNCCACLQGLELVGMVSGAASMTQT